MFKNDHIIKKINSCRKFITTHQTTLLSEEDYYYLDKCGSDIALNGSDTEKLHFYYLLKNAILTSVEFEEANVILFKALFSRYSSLIVLPEFRKVQI